MKNNIEANFASNVQALAKPGEDILKTATMAAVNRMCAAMELFMVATDELDKAKALLIYNNDKGKPHELITAIERDVKRHIPFLSSSELEKLHMAIGIAGEAGEILQQAYGEVIVREPDDENKVEELGDLEFYMEGYRVLHGITRNQTLEANIKKLSKRYRTGNYSDEQAQARADKQVDTEAECDGITPLPERLPTVTVPVLKDHAGPPYTQICGRADRRILLAEASLDKDVDGVEGDCIRTDEQKTLN